jgi:hypothetical protein
MEPDLTESTELTKEKSRRAAEPQGHWPTFKVNPILTPAGW